MSFGHNRQQSRSYAWCIHHFGGKISNCQLSYKVLNKTHPHIKASKICKAQPMVIKSNLLIKNTFRIWCHGKYERKWLASIPKCNHHHLRVSVYFTFHIVWAEHSCGLLVDFYIIQCNFHFLHPMYWRCIENFLQMMPPTCRENGWNSIRK